MLIVSLWLYKLYYNSVVTVLFCIVLLLTCIWNKLQEIAIMKEYIQYPYTDSLFIPMNSYSLILYTSGLEAWYCVYSLYDSWNNRRSWELTPQPHSLDSNIWPFQTLSRLSPCTSEPQYSLLSSRLAEGLLHYCTCTKEDILGLAIGERDRYWFRRQLL